MIGKSDKKRFVAFLGYRLVSGCISFLGTVVLAFTLASGTMTVRAQQTLVTFDDLTGSTIPVGYNGLNWVNFGFLNGLNYSGNPSGYQAGVVSSNNVTYNHSANPASITNTSPFDLISAYLTAAWNDNLQVEVKGYTNGTLIYDNTYTLSATVPTLINFNYFGVNEVYFNSFGGTPHPGYGSTGKQFVMDNVTVSNVTSEIARTWQSGLNLYYTDGTNTMPYRLYLPLNYNAATNYPLVLFLHGAGSSGTNNIAQVNQHIAGLIARTYSDYPAILVAPQSIGSYWWIPRDTDMTFGILAEVRRNYAVDDRRIYLTGLSNGGSGTAIYAYYFPTLFAAIAPMSSGAEFTPDDITENELSRLPTWLFHGSADTIISVAYSRDYYMLVTGLTNITFTQTNYGYPTAVSEPIRYTEFTGLGHDIWELIYGATNTDFYDWMFSQTRPPATFNFTAVSANGGTFVFGGSNSVPFATGYLLTSTNLQIPVSQWQCIATNWCDASGSLMFTNNLDPNENQRFYILQLQ
jgi:predicted esterase